MESNFLDRPPAKTRVMQVYISSIGTVNYAFGSPYRKGKIAHFINGEFLTDDTHEIAELDNEIALGHPHIHRPSKEMDKSRDILADPLQAVKDKAIADYVAEQQVRTKAALNPDNNMGTSDQSKGAGTTGIGTTANVGTNITPAASNPAVGAKLADLQKKFTSQ